MQRVSSPKRKDFCYHGLLVCCNLCGSNNSDGITKKDRDGYKTFKMLCRNCGLAYTNPLPTISELQQFYNTKFYKTNSEKFQPKLKRIYRAGVRACSRYNRIRPYLEEDHRVLDVSACMGEFVYLLRKKGIEAEGIEFNPHMINYASNEFDIQLHNQFLDNLDIVGEVYDIISSHHILNLCLNPLAMLKKYRKLLSKDGILNLEVPNIETKYTAPHKRFRFKHFYNFNLFTIQMLCKKAGFKVINTIFIPGSLHINIILKKAPQREIKIQKAENYNDVREAITGYKSLNYLLTSAPYIKIYDRFNKHIQMQKVTKNFNNGKEVLDMLYDEDDSSF